MFNCNFIVLLDSIEMLLAFLMLFSCYYTEQQDLKIALLESSSRDLVSVKDSHLVLASQGYTMVYSHSALYQHGGHAVLYHCPLSPQLTSLQNNCQNDQNTHMYHLNVLGVHQF